MRFTLLDLLGIVAYCGVLSHCLARVGFDNPMFWGATFLASAMGFVAVLGFRREQGRGWTWLVAVPVNSLFLCAGGASFALFVNGVLLAFAAAWFAWRDRPSWRSAVAAVLACHALAWMFATWIVEPELSRLAAARSQFPSESLAPRLAYEVKHPTESAQGSNVRSKVGTNLDRVDGLSTEVLKRLREDDATRPGRRGNELRSLHQGAQEEFIRGMGFGVTRMMGMQVVIAELTKSSHLVDVPFDGAESQFQRGWWFQDLNLMRLESLSDFHFAGRDDFLHPDGFGAILEPRDDVIGFVPHAFHSGPEQWGIGAERWQLRRLELVSLLKFETPRVYVLDHLPRMDQLSSQTAPTRPLDAFEVEALAKLTLETDVVVDERPNEIRMVGSLRASQPCLACHAVRHGALLGAFSYSLLQK